MFYRNTLPYLGEPPHVRVVILCTSFEFARRWAMDMFELSSPSYMKVSIFTTVDSLRGLDLSGIACLSLRTIDSHQSFTDLDQTALAMRARSIWKVTDDPMRVIGPEAARNLGHGQPNSTKPGGGTLTGRGNEHRTMDGRSAPIPGVPGGRQPRG